MRAALKRLLDWLLPPARCRCGAKTCICEINDILDSIKDK